MTDNTELQRLTHLRRLSRQIAASLPMDLDLEQAFQVQLPAEDLKTLGRRRRARHSTSSRAGDGVGELSRTRCDRASAGRPVGRVLR
jgi:hypothetical protein